MLFKFKMLTGIKETMDSNHLTIATLETNVEGIRYGVIFNVAAKDKQPNLLFIRPDNEEYKMVLTGNYEFPTFLGNKLTEFRDFFQISNALKNGTFKVANFFEKINSGLHMNNHEPQYNERVVYSQMNRHENPLAVYFSTFISHEANGDGEQFSQKNRQKVYDLLRDTYREIDGHNISVRFSPKDANGDSGAETRSIREKLKELDL
ncbi:hypothetical protein EQG49_07360 [Periweissella cryptocerci]|uniref:Uncharacterized protein n=1 Tax=Periweissella cryptocerci TaxID=2506420 RepID=A0A4P6YU87_9LACO|nr:DUF6037 family protein [Periweissella cryptocerci]QBO36292.1 hypothetical protein EQG49_07360 [Periweissella cryptocerci]